MNEMTNSHILVHEFDYLQPATMEDALALLGQYGDQARVLAGGTDLIVQIKMERLAPRVLIDINRIPGLDAIVVRDDAVHIGARASIRTVLNNALLQNHYHALAEACASFSTTQVQVMGTLGGNLCNGSPASDSAPALIAFGAQVIIDGPTGKRRIPLESFFLGPGKTAIANGELLTSVVLERPQSNTGSAFLKVSRVTADIAKVNAAVLLVRDRDGIISDCRMVFGSVAPIPMRAKNAEVLLRGQVFAHELVAEAALAASEEVVPIDDVRSTAWYRREIVRVLAHDGLTQAWHRARHADIDSRQAQHSIVNDDSALAQSGREVSPTAIHVHRDAPGGHEIQLRVNGEKHRVWVAPNDLLLNVLREKLELTGSKYGCGIGECGACTVQMNGNPVLSCLVLAVSADGSDITTVEGLRNADGELDPLQDAFIEHQAFQCGYCTPGMLMTAKSLLNERPSPTEAEVREYLKGNLCRCTGYARIVRAVMSCAETPATEKEAAP
jgi:xanthine dehydrogenase iron-sulfur cluster and FAD-binding subunit A